MPGALLLLLLLLGAAVLAEGAQPALVAEELLVKLRIEGKKRGKFD